MKIEKKKKINIASDSGFTITDLAIAIIIFLLFTGIMGSLFYNAFKTERQTQMSGAAINYAIQILEDIDKISYEEVTNDMEESYMSKFSISSAYNLKIEVTNYNEGNDKEDLIKIVKLTMEYELAGDSENIMIKKLKIKEM